MNKLCIALVGTVISSISHADITTFEPKKDWRDTNGHLIEAHGGHVLFKDGMYYFIGQDRTHNDNTFLAINCYSSNDLSEWQFENAVLTPTKNPELPEEVIIARPKFVYNEMTDSYVMWFKYRDPNGVSPNMKSGVASSRSPCGNYTVEDVFYPEIDGVQHYAGDNAIIVDKGIGYYILSSVGELDSGGEGTIIGNETQRRLKVFRLTDDYRNVAELLYEFPIEAINKERREGPALAKIDDHYVLLSSGTSGWGKNQQQYSTARSMEGPWAPWKNIGNTDGYGSQTAYIIPVIGNTKTTLIYGGDDHNNVNLKDSRYVWLPIKVDGLNLTLDYMNQWHLDIQKGAWAPTIDATLNTNTLHGTATLAECSTASNGYTINKLGTGGNNNGIAELDNLHVTNEGIYPVAIKYITDTDRDIDLYVNDIFVKTVTFRSSGSWCHDGGSPSEQMTQLPLKKGNNKITIKNENGNAPNIDSIRIPL